MKRKRIAIVIRGFGENVPNDPIPLWWKFAKKLAKEKDVEKVVILAPLTSGKVTFENGLTVIPTGKNPLKLITEVKRGKYQEVYIVGSYLSVIIYVILSGQKVRKKVYLMRNRIFWNEYFPVLRKYSKKTLKAYYLLSTVNLGYIYRLLTGRWNIAAYIFPSQNSSDAFAKDATIDSKMCFVMPSSPRMSIPYRNDRIPSKKPKALPRRHAGKKRIVYPGR
ncbi:hypothetical protein IID22_02660, partial [Patescibacteria group bacterium]|nr:hypothetical protein [Patescibacteria group bacterium]